MKAYRAIRVSLLIVALVFLNGSSHSPREFALSDITSPILFVTQVPNPSDFTTIGSVFGNHLPDIDSAPRGGDLMIRYPDGTLKNLTRLAGFGSAGMQGANAIAVREPSVHWSGSKAVFSMVIGAPTQQYVYIDTMWQLYEVTGLGRNDTPVITKVANQPPFNNISPIYGTDDRIIFTSDRPRNGAQHLHPQLDEYEEAPTVSGLWSLDANSGNLILLDHSPSGDFSPSIDSFGRVLFTRWDHLQRDQQADADQTGTGSFGTFDYLDESANAQKVPSRVEQFPEPREARPDLLTGTNMVGHSFNHFFPWQIHEDGREAETLNHIGRHELHAYFNTSLRDDQNVREFIPNNRFNPNQVLNILQMKEAPDRAGVYYAIDAPEFATHAAGQIVSMTAPPTLPADQIRVNWLTPRSTANASEGTAPPDHTGLYRNPLPLPGGLVVAVHTAETRVDGNDGTREAPKSRYDFRLKLLRESSNGLVPDAMLTSGITANITYWEPDVLVTFNGVLWELDPVEVRPRVRPARREVLLPAPEAAVFSEEGVDSAELRRYLEKNSLALVISRDITSRDTADRQQPFNLKVDGSTKQTVGAPGKTYDVKYMEFFQADQIRGIGGSNSPTRGRRVLAQRMHDPAVKNPAGHPQGAVRVAGDGSVAAFVPARRAMTWQLSDAQQVGVVRERYWLTFQPGEMRVCASCHGLNSLDQIGRREPVNKPDALRELLRFYKSQLRDTTPGRPRPVRR